MKACFGGRLAYYFGSNANLINDSYEGASKF